MMPAMVDPLAGYYRRQARLDSPPAVPAVLIQRMVEGGVSGVAFSADPVTGRAAPQEIVDLAVGVDCRIHVGACALVGLDEMVAAVEWLVALAEVWTRES